MMSLRGMAGSVVLLGIIALADTLRACSAEAVARLTAMGIRVVMLITAFGIALVKAYMVAKNFMHLNVEQPVIHYIMAIGVALMVSTSTFFLS